MNTALTARQREIVLPTAFLATLLVSLMRVYRKTYKNSLLPETILPEQAEKIITAMWEEAITERLRWVAAPVTADSTIDRVIPGYSDENNRNRAASIREEIILPVLDKCNEVIAHYIPDQSWNMWTVRYYGGGNHVLEEGADFRIYEWERMVREQQISYPHIILSDENEVHEAMTDLGMTKIDPNHVPEEIARPILEAFYRKFQQHAYPDWGHAVSTLPWGGGIIPATSRG